MIKEGVLRALQSRMRKLTVATINAAARAEHLRVAIEDAERAVEASAEEETGAERQSKRLMGDVKELGDYVDGLARSGQDQALVAALKEELAELEGQQREAAQRVDRLKAHTEALKQSLANSRTELETTEAEHRRISDQAMKLREHIEKVDH